MIGMKMIPASTGGGLGGCRDRDLLLGKSTLSLPSWAVELPHKVVNTIDGAPGWRRSWSARVGLGALARLLRSPHRRKGATRDEIGND
jgi:hypothetical protein